MGGRQLGVWGLLGVFVCFWRGFGVVCFPLRISALLGKCPWVAPVQEPWPPWPRHWGCWPGLGQPVHWSIMNVESPFMNQVLRKIIVLGSFYLLFPKFPHYLQLMRLRNTLLPSYPMVQEPRMIARK